MTGAMTMESTSRLKPVHPESVPGEPLRLRWVTPPGSLPVRGVIGQAPGELGRLFAQGLLAQIQVEPAAVLITLAAGGSWREMGSAVRTALTSALDDPEGWIAGDDVCSDGEPNFSAEPSSPVVCGHSGADRGLALAAQAVIDGPAGDYVRSHGGHIELVAVQDGRVDVRLSGACGHCAGATTTLHTRVEADLRAACPQVIEVRRVGEEPTQRRRPTWSTILRRNG